MDDFGASQTRLAQARAARDIARNDAKTAADVLRRARIAGTSTDAATATVAANTDVLKNATADVAAALAEFAIFSDPRRNVGRLSDDLPFLLLPVRIETRFIAGTDRQRQLLVRIYPDDCSIDTFEPVLSDAELANTKVYWQGVWRAGGIEDDERAAWRGLVAAHGSGRATYLVANYQPVNATAKPIKAAATDVILVIPTFTALVPTEAAATASYWQSVWRADGDATKTQAALATFEGAVGSARATAIRADYVPYNRSDTPIAPATTSTVALSTAFILFPADPVTKHDSWSQAPRVNHLADRFVVIGYTGTNVTLEAIGAGVSLPLYVGPDPSIDPAVDPTGAIHPDGGDLFIPDELAWLVDFEHAVAAGMGLRIDISADQAAHGFDRLIVLGLELSADQTDATTALQELLAHHQFGRSGLSLIPQGTPAHNTTGAGADYRPLDNADESFADLKHLPLFTPTSDPLAKRDGQWIAELLGLDASAFTAVHGSDGTDQRVSRAMQAALWPATFGYWMDKLMTPVFSDAAVNQTREFFTSYVSGRGAIPALRIGGQPYGILATTAFSRIAWLQERREVGRLGAFETGFLERFFSILTKVGTEWGTLAQGAAYVGKAGDPQQTLLDIVGHHPASVEFYSRYAETLGELFNIVQLWGFGPDFWTALNAVVLEGAGVDLLKSFGYAGAKVPDLLQQVFLANAAQIANVVDDRPLSETAPIRAYTDDKRNYITWLRDAAGASLDALREEQGFSGNVTPATLLYLFLRHALMLGFNDATYNLHRAAGFLSAAELAALKPEPTFIHVADGPVPSESRFAALYKTESRITSSPTLLVCDYIAKNVATLPESAGLAQQIVCLDALAGASTAALERAFAEHIDCCSYRFDAWLLGIVNFQLHQMRARDAAGQVPEGGVYLGAYAWVENLRPSRATLHPAQLPPDVAGDFPGTTPIVVDPSNAGYIHAPSLVHAKTAAVLRSGYVANATSANPATMAINLSSDRVRLALATLEGIRNGQSLGALLGYRFERALHDDFGFAEVDRFIFPMRKAFPLVADAIGTTKTDPDVSIESIEARNVIDGLKLVTQIRKSGATAYPFGVTLPPAAPNQAQAVTDAAAGLLDVYDALADVALAEGVHQAVQGNFERIAATLDAYATGNFPPEPEVVQTPPSGIGLTQRVAAHFAAGLTAPATAHPRAKAEPAIDAWAAALLPDLDGVGCVVTWIDPLTSAARKRDITLRDLDIGATDALALVKLDSAQSMTELDDRILAYVIATDAPRPDAHLQIAYMSAPAGKLSLFETAALFTSIKALIGRSRPLRASDALLHNGAAPQDDADVFIDRARIATPKADLDTLFADVNAFLATLQPLLQDRVLNRAALVSGIDGFLSSAVALLDRAARFNLPLCGWGFAFAWKRTAFADLLTAIEIQIARWDARLADFDAQVTAYDALPAATPNDARFRALQSAEVIIVRSLDPIPATPALLRAALDGRRTTFVARRDQLSALLSVTATSYSALLADANAVVTGDLDATVFDLTPFGDRAVAFAADLATDLAARATAIHARSEATQMQLDTHDAASAASARVEALQAAAKALLGDDFQLYPEFSLSAAQASQWTNVLAQSTSGALTNYLTTSANVDRPVDEWLYGIARVRPNMQVLERIMMFADAVGKGAPALLPTQFPYEPDVSWLALPYPVAYKLVSDHLLYTASYATPFDGTLRQCGILIDEWSEVIPAETRTTGISFNFDRPSNEAPQSMLLVTPASGTGTWQWDDLLTALGDTLDLAKKRAVEPAQIDNLAYSRFLPATVLASTTYGISISTTLAAANGVFREAVVK